MQDPLSVCPKSPTTQFPYPLPGFSVMFFSVMAAKIIEFYTDPRCDQVLVAPFQEGCCGAGKKQNGNQRDVLKG